MKELTLKWRRLAVGGLVFAVFALTSCDFNYETSYTHNNQIKITNNNDGLFRELEANQPVQIKDGVISGYEEGLVMELSEERNGKKCKAWLKEKEGVLTFEVSVDELIQEFYESKEDWLQDFLLGIGNTKGDSHSSSAILAIPERVEDQQTKLLKSIKESAMPQPEKKEALKGLMQGELTEEEQLAITEYILYNISLPTNRNELLTIFINQQNMSRKVKVYIADNIQNIPSPPEREEILALLVKR